MLSITIVYVFILLINLANPTPVPMSLKVVLNWAGLEVTWNKTNWELITTYALTVGLRVDLGLALNCTKDN